MTSRDSRRHHILPNIQDGGQYPEVVIAIFSNIVVVSNPKQTIIHKTIHVGLYRQRTTATSYLSPWRDEVVTLFRVCNNNA